MNALIIRLVCGLLFTALVAGVMAHPPANLSQGLGMLLPAAFLLNYTLRGPRRSLLPKKRPQPAPPPDGQAR